MLEAVFMVRQLVPWHANLKKRQVKAPKIYFRDSGLLHMLLGIRTEKELLEHLKSGASWQGFVSNQVLETLQPDESYFWATHNGAELDLLLMKNGRRIAVECKRVNAPRLTTLMRIALQGLKLESLFVIYPGIQRYNLSDQVQVLPLSALAEENAERVFGLA